jgi:hypothetical protein
LEGLNSLNLKEIKSRKEADDQLDQYIPELGVRQFLLKSLTRDSEGFAWKINLKVITEKIENVGEALADGTVFEGPTLFLAGANSNYIQEKDISDLEAHFPNYELEFIPNAGHWLHAEQPQAVVAEMRNFSSRFSSLGLSAFLSASKKPRLVLQFGDPRTIVQRRLSFNLRHFSKKNLRETYFTQIYREKTRRFSSLHFQFLSEPKETCIVQFDKLSTVDR